MSFASESGYTPQTIDAIMTEVMDNINAQFGTTYDFESFVGTNFYKYFYALAQKFQKNEILTSEVFGKIQDYFNYINAVIARPVVTPQGLIDYFKTFGYTASVKAPIDADAGKAYVCVLVDNSDPDYATIKAEVCLLVQKCVVGGVISQGSEVESIVLTNGQAFDFKFVLPNIINTHLRLTIPVSENNQYAIPAPEDTKELLMANIAARYNLGRNFEPQRYFSVLDAPWAESVLLEYSLDAGVSWASTVYDAEYDDYFAIDLANITII